MTDFSAGIPSNAHTPPGAVAFSATAMAVNCALSNVFTTTLTANVTTAPTFSNLKDGQTINWRLKQDATGPWLRQSLQPSFRGRSPGGWTGAERAQGRVYLGICYRIL